MTTSERVRCSCMGGLEGTHLKLLALMILALRILMGSRHNSSNCRNVCALLHSSQHSLAVGARGRWSSSSFASAARQSPSPMLIPTPVCTRTPVRMPSMLAELTKKEDGRAGPAGARKEGTKEERGHSHIRHADLMLLPLPPFIHHSTAWQWEHTVDGVLVLLCQCRLTVADAGVNAVNVGIDGHRILPPRQWQWRWRCRPPRRSNDNDKEKAPRPSDLSRLQVPSSSSSSASS
jgi:hypothetical protein